MYGPDTVSKQCIFWLWSFFFSTEKAFSSPTMNLSLLIVTGGYLVSSFNFFVRGKRYQEALRKLCSFSQGGVPPSETLPCPLDGWCFSVPPFLRGDPPILFQPKGWFQSRDEVWSKCSRWSLSATSSVYGFFPRYESAVNLAFEPEFACFSPYNAFLSRLTRCEETDRPGEGGM